jgi:hypothetical protein
VSGFSTSLRRKLAGVTLFTLTVVLLTEGGLRGFHASKASPYREDEVETRIRTITEGMGADVLAAFREPENARRWSNVPHPYLAFDHENGNRQLVEEMRVAQEDDESHYDVVILGGSVAGRLSLGEETLIKYMEADPRLAGRSVRIFNHGRGAYKQPQQALLLQYLLILGVRPDAVICVDGLNEITLGYQNAIEYGLHPLLPSPIALGFLGPLAIGDDGIHAQLDRVRAWKRRGENLSDWVDRSRLDRSAIVGQLALALARYYRRHVREESTAIMGATTVATRGNMAFRGPVDDLDRLKAVEDPIGVLVNAWAEGSRLMYQTCQARGIAYLHVLQPTLHDAGSKVPTEEELRNAVTGPSFLEGVRLGYPLLRETGALLASEGVPFHDSSGVFAGVEETLYFDVCHLGEKGRRILTEDIARAFLDTLPPKARDAGTHAPASPGHRSHAKLSLASPEWNGQAFSRRASDWLSSESPVSK